MPPAVLKVQINANVAWRSFESQASRRVIAVCDVLNITLEADSQEELQSLIPEAMHLLFKELLSDNEFDQYLREKGWSALNVPSRPVQDIQFELSWHVIAEESKRDRQRRAN